MFLRDRYSNYCWNCIHIENDVSWINSKEIMSCVAHIPISPFFFAEWTLRTSTRDSGSIHKQFALLIDGWLMDRQLQVLLQLVIPFWPARTVFDSRISSSWHTNIHSRHFRLHNPDSASDTLDNEELWYFFIEILISEARPTFKFSSLKDSLLGIAH